MERYFKIRSWHRIGHRQIRLDGKAVWRGLCGRRSLVGSTKLSVDLPADEKSCETCLRIDRRREEKQADGRQ